jgi:thiamine pyrophosphate-dependent acetolactate synthase large subunit-like protein
LGSHFGFHGERVEYRAELEIALKSAFAATKEGRTAILNVMVSR